MNPRKKVIYSKRGKSCEICGCSELKYLEYDHINPSNKVDNVSSSRLRGKQLENELKKCRILCRWCHRIHTFNQCKRKIVVDYRWTEDELNCNCERKKCCGAICNGSYIPINLFGKHIYCKKCVNYRSMIWRNERKEYINKRKRNIGKCTSCSRIVEKGFEHCFDFDHLNQETKTMCISNMTTRSFKKIDEEIGKCQLLCCYCHVDKTVKQLNQYNEQVYKKINRPVDVYRDYFDIVIKELNKTVKTFHNVPKCKRGRTCSLCSSKISKSSRGLCLKCYRKNNKKVKRPLKEQLILEIKELGYCGTGRKYGVSDNAIRKWVKTC